MSGWTNLPAPVAGPCRSWSCGHSVPGRPGTRRLEEALRAGKRQAAPFRKGPPKPKPQQRPQCAGRAEYPALRPPAPAPARASYAVLRRPPAGRLPPLPGTCGRVQRRRAVPDRNPAAAGRAAIPGPHRPLPQFWLAAASRARHPCTDLRRLGQRQEQIGPDARAAASAVSTQMGLSHGKVATVFDALFGIDLTRGASAQINLRAAARLEPDPRILDGVRASERIAAARPAGSAASRPGAARGSGDRVTAYAVDRRRSGRRVGGSDRPGLGRPAVPRRLRLLRPLRGGAASAMHRAHPAAGAGDVGEAGRAIPSRGK